LQSFLEESACFDTICSNKSSTTCATSISTV
jgi:hypothetical protein